MKYYGDLLEKMGLDQDDMANDAKTTAGGRRFEKDPSVNVITKEDFEDRVEKVFHLLWEVLSKSFGPYGAPTIICNYPQKHVTKDGFTIMKNLSMDASDTLTDQSIADLVSDICGRLNYTVGDATTTAIIASNQLYNSYREHKDELIEHYIMPRDVLHIYDSLKDRIMNKLIDKVKPIRNLPIDEMTKHIRDVVYISSNGDPMITDHITGFYKELGNPSITCALAPDGITKQIIVDGYSYDLILNDKMYINNDENTMQLRDTDVVIFGIKINTEIYEKILKPLNYESHTRGRHLLVCAPSYDEKALSQTIAIDLTKEKTTRKDVNMVLTTFKSFNSHYRKVLGDFAMLMNTTVLDRAKVEQILNQVSAGQHIPQLFNIDQRGIDGINCVAISEDKENMVTYIDGSDEGRLEKLHYTKFNDLLPLHEQAIRLGFVHKCELGLDKSLFQELVYNETLYEDCLRDAKIDLEEKERKYKRLGTFNIEVSQAQQRLYALTLKMGLLEVGATSELAQGMIKDAVDDSIRAAKSAFDYGVVLGCNCSLLESMYEVKKEIIKDDTLTAYAKDVQTLLMDILIKGFMDVYRTVLMNAFDDIPLMKTSNLKFTEDVNLTDDFMNTMRKKFQGVPTFDIDKTFDKNRVANAIAWLIANRFDVTVHNVIVAYSIQIHCVFDVSRLEFSNTVINSAQTDQEVLNACIDLLALLITGNQMVVTQKRNFDIQY